MALDSYASPNIIPELRQPNAAAGKITLDRMAVTPSVKKRRLSMVEFPYAQTLLSDYTAWKAL